MQFRASLESYCLEILRKFMIIFSIVRLNFFFLFFSFFFLMQIYYKKQTKQNVNNIFIFPKASTIKVKMILSSHGNWYQNSASLLKAPFTQLTYHFSIFFITYIKEIRIVFRCFITLFNCYKELQIAKCSYFLWCTKQWILKMRPSKVLFNSIL
jgi:hypothetical protein